MAAGKEKQPKPPKEKKPKKEKAPKPKKEKAPKKPKKGQEVPQEGEVQEEEGKKKKPLILIILLILIPVVVIGAAAAVFFLVFFPKLTGGSDDPGDPSDPGVIETPEPLPPELPETLMVGQISVPGMTLEADESGAQAVLAKTVTYTYINLNDAGAAAKTYMDQLISASPRFYIVDEDFVRITEDPDFTAAEGMVLLARNLTRAEFEAEFGVEEVEETPAPTDPPEEESGEPEGSAPVGSAPVETPAPTATPEPEEPVDETPSYVITVRITWSEGQCVVVADEEEGEVTSPPHTGTPGGTPSIGIRDAEEQLMSMTPAELGLPGTSMSEQYEVFWQDGTELVNDVTCIRLDVYNSSDGPNPYLFASSYLMSVDGAHLYKLDPITNELQELDFTLNVG